MAAACVLASLALRGLAARFPDVVESLYARRLAPLGARLLSGLTGVVPWSVAETGVAALVLAAAWAVVGRLRGPAARLGRAGLVRLLATGALVGSLLLLTFDLAWGLHYFRRDLADRLAWREPPMEAKARLLEAVRLAAELVEATNAAYAEATGTADLGRPSEAPPRARVDAALEEGHVRAGTRLGLEPAYRWRRGPAKPLALSFGLSRLGLAGVYVPWTAEATYNRDVPAALLPHVVAHEKAHQRGAAREDEAQFLGFLACVEAADPYVRYSGYLHAQRELLFQVREVDAEATRSLVSRRHRGVQRDVTAAIAFWQRHEGVASRAADAVNDRYLRAQGVPDGIRSYRRGARLVALFARANGGSPVLRPPARPPG